MPSAMIATASFCSSGEPSIWWRSSISSWSGIRVLAQCTAPVPIPKRARNRPVPRRMLDVSTAPAEVSSPSGTTK